MVFNPRSSRCIKEVKAERIFIDLDFTQKPMSQKDPLGFPYLTLKYAFLHPSPIIFTSLGHPSKASATGFFHRCDIISDQNQHWAVVSFGFISPMSRPWNAPFTSERTASNRRDLLADTAPKSAPEEMEFERLDNSGPATDDSMSPFSAPDRP